MPALLAVFLPCAAFALDEVTLQLKWRHQFQFAGYYAALEQGYYRDAGMDVRLLEASSQTDVVEEVASGRAEFGVGMSDLLLARRRTPVVALAVIFQHSPLILLADASKVGNLHELAGQPVAVERHSEELFAYLRSEMLPPEKLRIQPHSLSVRDLAEGRVAAMSAYSTTETYQLRGLGIQTIEFSPRAGGVDFYGDNLFTVEEQVRKHPERVRAFRAASLRGWEYAMRHPDEVIELILRKYNTQKVDRAFLEFEARRTKQLLQAELVEVGHMNPGRWQHIAQTYASLSMRSEGALPDGFLYVDQQERMPAWVLPGGVVALSLLALFAWLARRNVVLARRLRCEIGAHEEVNRQLSEKLSEIQALEDQLREQALRDPMTRLHNRRYFDETLPRELARASREGYPLSLILIDLDHFKLINDSFGHPAGDEVICALAEILRAGARERDIVCRYGGEEFIVALPQMSLENAVRHADEWRVAMENTSIQHGVLTMCTTFSAGVAAFPDHGCQLEKLIEFADTALYDSKQNGRNRVSGCPLPTTDTAI